MQSGDATRFLSTVLLQEAVVELTWLVMANEKMFLERWIQRLKQTPGNSSLENDF